MACNFVQTKSMRMVRSKITSRGNMYYSKPNKLRWEYTSPYRYTFILNGQTVWMKNSRGSNQVNVAQSKMFSSIIVYFDMSRSMVSAVKMVEKNGDTTYISLRNVRTNIPINGKTFSLH